ncbi:MAG: hypothetical protein ACC661_10310 [Verrucomicrobiales bacterium]
MLRDAPIRLGNILVERGYLTVDQIQAALAHQHRSGSDKLLGEVLVELVERLPEGRNRENTLRNLVSTWARQDPVQSSQWLDRMPVGAERDRAIEGFSQAVIQSDPEAALIWASSLGEERSRNQLTRSLARRWLATDRHGASAWIETSDLFTPDTKASLLKK